MKHTILLSLMLLTALAGCAETPSEAEGPDAQATVAPPRTGTAAAIPVDAAGPDNETASWFALDLHRNVTGLRWSVPEDAVRSHRITDTFSLEAVPLVATLLADEVESYGIFVYDLSRGARLVSSVVAAPLEGTSYFALPLASEGTWKPEVRPVVLRLPEEMAGKEVGIVVATHGASEDAAFAWSLLDHYPWNHDEVPGTPQEFLDGREGPVGVVTPTGHGDRFRYSVHQEVYLGLLYTPGLFGGVYGTGDVTVEERLPTWVPPYGGARDVTFHAAHDLEGWSASAQIAWNSGAVGDYAMTTDAQGTTGGADGVILSSPLLVYGVDWMLTGFPLLLAEADGSGGAENRLDLRTATDNDVFVTYTELISFDATLEELVGVGSVDEVVTWDGLLRFDGTGLVRLGADGGSHARPLP